MADLKINSTVVSTNVEQINSLISFLEDAIGAGGRYDRIGAFDWLTGLAPIGFVKRAEEDIFLIEQHLINLRDMVSYLLSLPVCEESLATEEPDPTDPTDPTEESDCDDLVNAINNFNIDITADLDAFLIGLMTQFRAELTLQLNALFDRLTNNFDDLFVYLDEQFSFVFRDLTQINENILIINETTNDTYSLVLAIPDYGYRFIEILERIHDTRTELKQANDRLIVIEECVCPSNDGGLDIDEITNALILALNARFDENSQYIINELFSKIKTDLAIQFGDWYEKISTRIDNPNYRLAFETSFQLILSKLEELDNDIENIVIGNVSLDIDFAPITDRLTEIDILLRNLQSDIDSIENDINTFETIGSQIITTTNNTYQTTISNNQIINNLTSTVDDLDSDIEKILNELQANLIGSYEFITCDSQKVESQTLNYAGTGLNGINQALIRLSEQLKLSVRTLCTETVSGTYTPYDCGVKAMSVPYTYSSLKDGVEKLHTRLTTIEAKVCEIGSDDCLILEPGDKQLEMDIQNQLIIKLKQKDGNNTSNWQLVIPEPIEDIDWCKHIEPLYTRPIKKGRIFGRIFFGNDRTHTWSYFESVEEAERVLEQILAPLSTLPVYNPFNPGKGRYTIGGSPKRQIIGRELIPYKVIVAKKDALTGNFNPEQCITRPRNGC